MTAKDVFQELYDGYVDRYRSNDAAGCASYFAENAELFSPYGPAAIGRQAIEDIHSEWVEEGGEDKVIEIVHADINDNVGWCLARYSEGTTGQGTSLNILYKQADGRWLITQCSLNEAL
nr:nuclear transport factor 2 family protein [uncultured Ruegeria sp.]